MAQEFRTKHPSTWTYQDAQAAIAYAIETTVTAEGFKQNRLLAEDGNHFQDGAHIPDTGDPSLRVDAIKRLRKEQAPTDAANEIIDNTTNGLLGTEAAVTFERLEPFSTPPYADEIGPDGEAIPEAVEKNAEMRRVFEAKVQKSKDRAELMHSKLSTWWDDVAFWERTRTAMRRALWAARGDIRVRVPGRFLVTGKLPTGLTASQAFSRITVESPMPDKAHVYIDADRQDKTGIFIYKQDDISVAEIWYVEGVDEEAKTYCRIVREGSTDSIPIEIPTRGYLPMVEITIRPMLTESVRQQQYNLDLIGLAGSSATRNAGFRARYTQNAQATGTWSRTAPTASPPLRTHIGEDGVKWYLIETPLYMGSGVTVQLTGEITEDTVTDEDSGQITTKRTIATPGVQLEDPVDPDYFIKAAEHRRTSILREGKQGHFTLTRNAETSGVAYVQARAAFKQTLDNARGPLERSVRDILSYVISQFDLMLEDGSELKGFLDEYRVQVTAHVDAGPLTPEERNQFILEWEKGASSISTLLQRLGIEDVGSELESLKRDPMARLAYIKKVGETLASLAALPQSSLAGALRVLRAVGVETQILDALVPREDDLPEIPDPNNPGITIKPGEKTKAPPTAKPAASSSMKKPLKKSVKK